METRSEAGGDTAARAPIPGAARWMLVTLILFAAALRLYDIDRGLWADEMDNHMAGSQGIAKSLEWRTLHPLLPFVSALTFKMGDQPALLRLPHVLFGLVSIVAVFLFVRVLRGDRAGLLAALLLAVSPIHVFFSQEARYYALMILAGIAALWTLHRGVRGGGPWTWLLFAATAWIGLLNHPLFLPFFGVFSAGAFLWLMGARGLSRRTRIARLAALVLSAALGLAAFGATFAAISKPGELKQWLFIQDADPAPEPAAQAAPDPAPAASTPTYRLQPREYFLSYYLNFYLETPTRPLALFLIALAAAGWIVLWRTRRDVALMTALAVAVVPLPFFLRDAGHWYSHRYFIIQMPIVAILAAVGLDAAGRAVARLPWAWARRHEPWIGALVAVALLVPLAPSRISGLARHYRTQPISDWRTCAEQMGAYLRPGDAVGHVWPVKRSKTDWLYSARLPLNFYLERLPQNGPAYAATLPQQGVEQPTDLAALLLAHPMSNVWVVNNLQPRRPPEEAGFLETMTQLQRPLGGIELRVRGEPTLNLLTDGGFEGPAAEGVVNDPAFLGGPEEAFSGQRCMRATIDEPGPAVAAFRVNDPSYRLRNASFAVWKEGVPVGWDVAPAVAERLAPHRPAREAPAVEIKGGDQAVRLRQAIDLGLAPGHRASVKCLGRTGGDLRIALLYRDRAGAPFRHEVRHPGDGQWRPMVIEEAIPADADPYSFAVEIVRTDDRRESAFAGSVEVGVLDAQGRFDTTRDYTLSLALKHRDIQPGIYPSRIGKVVFSGTGSDGGLVWKELYKFRDTRDWHLLLFPIRKDDLPPVLTDAKVSVGIFLGTGTVWVDNVQLEPKDHATPFTDGVRLPHDEALALYAPGRPGS